MLFAFGYRSRICIIIDIKDLPIVKKTKGPNRYILYKHL